MGVIPFVVRTISHSTSSSSSYGYQTPSHIVAGATAGSIIGVMLLIFVICLFIFYEQEKKKERITGNPVSWGTVIVKAALYAVFVGLVLALVRSCYGAEGGGGGSSSSSGGGGGDNSQTAQPQTAENSQVTLMSTPAFQPEPMVVPGPRFYDSVHGGAVNPIQGRSQDQDGRP